MARSTMLLKVSTKSLAEDPCTVLCFQNGLDCSFVMRKFIFMFIFSIMCDAGTENLCVAAGNAI